MGKSADTVQISPQILISEVFIFNNQMLLMYQLNYFVVGGILYLDAKIIIFDNLAI